MNTVGCQDTSNNLSLRFPLDFCFFSIKLLSYGAMFCEVLEVWRGSSCISTEFYDRAHRVFHSFRTWFSSFQFTGLIEWFHVEAGLLASSLFHIIFKMPREYFSPAVFDRKNLKNTPSEATNTCFTHDPKIVLSFPLFPLLPPFLKTFMQGEKTCKFFCLFCFVLFFLSVPQMLSVLCTLLLSAQWVLCVGAACSLPSLSWQVGCPPSERGEAALLALYVEISHFLASRAVSLVLLHCLPTETDSLDYCVHSERSRKNITSSLCIRSHSFLWHCLH